MLRNLASIVGVSLVLSLGTVSCSSGPAGEPDDGVESGVLMLTTPNVPSDVRCIVLTVVGPGATTTRSFDVTPSQAASLTATGLPIGSATLSQAAFNTACSQVTSQTPMTWVSAAPVIVQIVAGQSTSVSMELRRAGGVAITTTFSDNADGGVENNAPTIATAASANPNPVIGKTTTLSVLGADDNGESNLTYTWATTGTPPAAVSFARNGSNAAKTTTATFAKAGTYAFQVTVRDQQGLTALSATSVTVTASAAGVTVTPDLAYASMSATQQFTAVARDQFWGALPTQPTFTWSVNAGGTISASGLFTAGATSGGPFVVTAGSGSLIGSARVTVLPAPTRVALYQIDSGSSSAVSPFSADTYGSGGTAHSVTNTITTTGVTNPAPAAVYQSERYGNTTYTIPNLVASSQYVVRLHFAEIYWTATGKRAFNVSINGAAVLSNFDIYSAAGGQYKALVREFTATANASGQIVVTLTTVTDNASISGIEVLGFSYANGSTCSQSTQCQSGRCVNGTCMAPCTSQSSQDLIAGAGFDTASTLSAWNTSAGGTSWSSDDAEKCPSSGSVSFAVGGSMSYCVHAATGGAAYYLGMKGQGSVGCTGMFFTDTNCTNAVGPDWLNLFPSDSSSWQTTTTGPVTAPSGTQSIQIQCLANSEGTGTGAIDQIYLNQGTPTGFTGASSCSPQSSQDLIPGAGFDAEAVLSNWNTNQGGISWNGSDDAGGCASSGSIWFAKGASMVSCIHSATGGAAYYLGMKGQGSVGCTGMFFSDTNCTNGVGPDWLNLFPSDSSSWQTTTTGPVTAPSGAQSIQIQCLANSEGTGTGGIDKIYLNRGTLTGFGD